MLGGSNSSRRGPADVISPGCGPTPPRFKIGEVAKRTGVSVDTVRFYERMGLLPPARRTTAGYRSFGPAAVQRILFAKQAQALGFKLHEVAAMLGGMDFSDADCTVDALRSTFRTGEGRGRLAAVLSRVNDEISRLYEIRHRIQDLLGERSAGG